MRRASLPPALLLALLLALLPVLAAAPPAEAQSGRRAPRAGVLLGVAGHGTYWIAPDAAGRLRALGPTVDLIVPRDSAFWRVAVVDALVETDSGAVAVGADPADSAAIAPRAASGAEPPGETESGAECEGEECETPGDWFAVALVAAPADADDPAAVYRATPEALRDLRESEGARDLTVTFVGADWIAWTESFETDGPAPLARNEGAMLPIDSIAARPYASDSGRALTPFHVDAATAARHRRECQRQYVRSDSRGVEGADLYSWPTRGTFLQHLSGRWRIVERFSMGSGALRGFVFDCVLSDTVPASIVGHDRLNPPWAEIRRQVPGATDAVSSPAGDLVVVATDEALLAFLPRGGRLGAPALRLPLSFPRIVMARWAAGGEVGRWTRALEPHLEDPPPR